MDLEASMIQVDLEKKHEEIVWQEIAKYPRIYKISIISINCE